jgi:hypothetical protein
MTLRGPNEFRYNMDYSTIYGKANDPRRTTQPHLGGAKTVAKPSPT